MSRAASAWMPLYVGDYLKDTSRLTTEQHGAYLLLIMDYWTNGAPPDDDGVLQQIVKADKAAWKRMRPSVSGMFQIVDGRWQHKRIDREIEAAAKNSERRSTKARKAAQARWGECQDDAHGNAARNAMSNARSKPQALLDDCPPPSPIPSTDVDGADGVGSAAPDELALGDTPSAPTVEKQFWGDAIAYLGSKHRSKIGQWVRDHGVKATRAALDHAKAENEGQGAANPIAFMAAVLRNGAERAAQKAQAEREERAAFDQRFPEREWSEDEARLHMTDREFEQWRARRRAKEASA